MGCDIHVFVERKINGVWTHVPESLGPISHLYTIHNMDYFNERTWRPERNYQLFAILANVRNYGKAIVPLSSPRGIPNDVSNYVKKQSDDFDMDGHSHSYFLISELLQFKKTNKLEFRTYLNINQYEKFLDGANINSLNIDWSLSRELDDYKLLSNDDMKELVNNIVLLDDNNYLTAIDSYEPLDKCQLSFFDYYLPEMAKLDSNPKNIRVVFWFDN